jgi:hypothetical protein
MTEYPTRRALREAEARTRRTSRRPATPQAVAAPRTPTERPQTGPSRSRRLAVIGAGATLLLAGSAIVALPADAATVDSQTVLASELLGTTQTLSVDASVQRADAKLESYDAHAAAQAQTGGGAATSPVAVTSGGLTNADWAALVLQDSGLPVTQNNVTVILQWMDSENNPRSWFLRNNPLNNGLGSGGGGGFGRYASLTIAAEYVAKQLDRSLFAGIRAALAADSAPSVTAQAIMASAWAGSHYGYGRLWHAVDVPIVAAPASDW